MVSRILAAGLLLLLAAAAGWTESEVTVELTNLAGIARSGDYSVGATGSSEAKISYRSRDNRDVKAQVTLDAAVAETAMMDVSRAFIKTRFPGFRLTIGKTRLAWGDGFMFNAGDVIFDSVSTSVDLTGDELRTAGKWLASAYVPLGRFSYAEAVVLPPQFDPLTYTIDSRIAEQTGSSPPELPGGEETSGGMRLVFKPAGIKLETGYLYSGKTSEHRPYINLQGNLLVDWNISASTALGNDPAEEGRDNLAVSFGLFRLFKTGYSSTLNVRLEGLLRPWGSWEVSAGDYGLYLYPELSFSPDDRRTVFYRAVVSPVDVSAIHIVGASWNIYQGFKLLFYAGAATGEDGDTFSWNDSYETSALPGYFLSAGCSFAF